MNVKPAGSLKEALKDQARMSWKDLIRFAMHFPVGIFVTWLTTNMPATPMPYYLGRLLVAALLCITFLGYEFIEDWRIFDLSFKDIFGFASGLGTGGFIFIMLGWYDIA